MASADEAYAKALQTLPPKPGDVATRIDKQRYSQRVSQITAQAFAEELRKRGLEKTLPATTQAATTGAERRMSGGIGAKKVDVTWATEESGLLLGISIKSINFRDGRSGNYQKNLTNRRGDMLFEAVTLHRRFPYAVLGGVMLLDEGAGKDHTEKRKSTFLNAHNRLSLFTGRTDPAGREEQFEALFIGLLNGDAGTCTFFPVGAPETHVSLESLFDQLVQMTVQRNADFYEYQDGSILYL